MSKVYEKMPGGRASTKLNVVIPNGVKSVTLTFGGDDESQFREKVSKGGRRKVCD